MKTIKLIIFITITFCFIQSCNEKSKAMPEVFISNRPCYIPFQILENGDTINKMYNNEIKEGLWISHISIARGGKLSIASAGTGVINIKVEEGYYKNNKKEGFWKFYDRYDGTFKDSVKYKNDIVVK